MNKLTEITLLDEAAQALREHGLAVAVQKEPRVGRHLRADAWLRVGKGKTHIDYVVEAKRTVTPATMGAAVMQLRHMADAAGRPPLLVADHLTRPVADQLRAHKQQFADAAGNAYLEGPALLVYVTGRKPKERQAAARANKTFTATGLKILFALICDPELAGAPHRTIAAAAGVALGAVPAALADLQQLGYLLVANKRRRLNATKRLLDEWALAYARTLRAKSLLGTYIAQDFDTWQKWKLDPHQARWGGEPAAQLLVRYLKPGVLTIYADKLPPRLMVEHRLVAAGRTAHEHLVEARKPFWGHTLRTEGRPDTVPPALVYADLLATGDGRCIETAQMVYERYLARLFPAG
jgi:hypothetical protein